MIFHPAKVHGAYVVDMERRTDHRGFFARAWCQREYEAQGLTPCIAQVNVSQTLKRGALRGMHFQLPPFEEAKVVRCLRGAIYDVVLDLRPQSPSYLQWDAVELTAENHRQFYLPEGCAHGFQALTSDVEVLYLMSEFYAPEHGGGVRYDDPAFAIEWPLPISELSEQDRHWPLYRPLAPEASRAAS